MSKAILHLTADDFDLAFDLTKEQLETSFKNNEGRVDDILFSLAEQDLDTFISLSASLPETAQKGVTRAIAASLLKSDFPAAISHLANHQDGPAQLLATENLIGSRLFTEALIENYANLPTGWLQQILDGRYGHSQSPEILSWLELDPTRLGITHATFERLFANVGTTDFGPGTIDRVISILNRDDLSFDARDSLLIGQVDRWANEDPGQAKSQLSKINDLALRERGFESLAQNEKLDAHAAEAVARRTDELSVHDSDVWTQTETRKAIAIFHDLSPGEQRDTFDEIQLRGSNGIENRTFTSGILAIIASQAPSEDLETHNIDLRYTSSFATHWAIDSPATAAAWVNKLPAGDHRLWAARNVDQVWQQYAPSEAASWLKTLPAEEQTKLKTFLAR